ncbi:unnamed protein product, partial [Durusdinium trenchii]
MVLRLNKHLLWEVGLEASCLQGLWPLCRQVHGALLNFVENLTEISLQEAHCNFYLSELLACRTRGLARLQIGARSWDLASLEDGQHLILPSLSEREALMLSPQLRRMNHLKKITVGLKGPTIWVRPLRLAPSRRVRWSQVAHWHLGVVEWTLVAGLLRKAGSDSLWDRWPGCLE